MKLLIRRGIAFLVDFNLFLLVWGIVDNMVAVAVPDGLFELAKGAAFALYFGAVTAVSPAAPSPGSLLLGLRVVSADATGLSRSRVMLRALVLGLALVPDWPEVIRLFTFGRLPLWGALTATAIPRGLVAYGIAVALLDRSGLMPYDRWTRTRALSVGDVGDEGTSEADAAPEAFVASVAAPARDENAARYAAVARAAEGPTARAADTPAPTGDAAEAAAAPTVPTVAGEAVAFLPGAAVASRLQPPLLPAPARLGLVAVLVAASIGVVFQSYVMTKGRGEWAVLSRPDIAPDDVGAYLKRMMAVVVGVRSRVEFSGVELRTTDGALSREVKIRYWLPYAAMNSQTMENALRATFANIWLTNALWDTVRVMYWTGVQAANIQRESAVSVPPLPENRGLGGAEDTLCISVLMPPQHFDLSLGPYVYEPALEANAGFHFGVQGRVLAREHPRWWWIDVQPPRPTTICIRLRRPKPKPMAMGARWEREL